MATKTVTPSSAEGALIWTSKFSDFLIINSNNSKNSFCVYERSCSHNVRINHILWRIHFQRSVSLDSRSCRVGTQKILHLYSLKWLQIFKNGFNIMEKASYWLQHVILRIIKICRPYSLTMCLKSSQDTTKEGQYFPERVKFRVCDGWKYSKYSKISMCDHLLKATTSYPISYH